MKLKSLILPVLCLLIASPALAQEREEMQAMSTGDTYRKYWGLTLFSIASVRNSFRQVNEPRTIDSYNYFGLNYRIDSDTRLSLRIPFLLNTEGYNMYNDKMVSKGQIQDIHVAYSRYDLGYIGDIDLSGNVKAYMPTSEWSAKSGMIARFRGEIYFEYAIGRFSAISYGIKGDIFWQRNRSYIDYSIPRFDDGNFMRDPRGTTRQYSLEHFVEAYIDINQYFTVKPRVGFDEDWYYSSETEALAGRHQTVLRSALGLEVRPFRGWRFTFAIQDQTRLQGNRGKDVAFWEPQNIQYSLMTNGSIF